MRENGPRPPGGLQTNLVFSNRVLGYIFLGLLLSPGLASADPASDAAYASVLERFVRDGRVDYAALKYSRAGLDLFLADASNLQRSEFSAWPKPDRLAFLINVYNAATLRLIIDRYPIKSIRKIGPLWNPKAPWTQPVVTLFGSPTSLDDLEQRMIRPAFQEPRVHFALVCAARGCPPLRSEPYEGARLNAQLDNQAWIFLTQNSKNSLDETTKTAYLSPIFKWYLKDFGGSKKSLLAYLKKWLPAAENYYIEWTPYDWSLNDRPPGPL